MASRLLALLAVPVFLRQALAFNCSIPPIYVDIHKRAVHGTDVFQYGSFIGFGTLAQNQSLWPSLSQNETTIADVNFCSESTLENCEHSTRGNFDTSSSTTWVKNAKFSSLDATNPNLTTISGTDEAHLYTHYFETDGAWQNLIPNFPLQVATNGSAAPGIVGVGLASTLLQKLFDAGLIAGRTYSLYLGSGFDRAAGLINGSNTFGGYDAGRFKLPIHNYSIKSNDKHPLAVRVSDIVLNDATGLVRNVSLFDPAAFPEMKARPAAFEARITTDQYPMSFPYQLTQNFISRLAAVPSGNPDGSLKLNKPFNGTMTITLEDGFSVTLPSNVMYNVSGLSPVAARDEKSAAPFYLSAAWLSQVYLMINYDAYTFHLAQAIPENKFVMPVTWCPKGAFPMPYDPPARSVMTRAQLVGAVLGGVMGGMFIIIFVIAMAMWWRSQQVVRKEKKAEEKRIKGKMARFEIEEASEEGSVQGKKKKGGFLTAWKR